MWSPNELLKIEKQRDILSYITLQFFHFKKVPLEHYPLVQQSFLSEYPVKVINNGIDTKKFYPSSNDFRKRHGAEDKILLLGVANVWNAMKGYSDYIKLAGILEDRYRIVMVGLSKKQMKEASDKIIGIKKTNSMEELVQIYSACDIFLNLTYCDNYPTVNLEAIACNLPVLTYDTGGSTECLRFGRGLVAKKEDYADIKHKIAILSEEKVVNENREKIDKSYCYREYVRLMNEMCS